MISLPASQATGPGLLQMKRETLPQSIANVIAEAIASGRMVAGERIVETMLAAQLDVSRVPVREALKILHTQGIISGGGHRGFRVASFSPKMVHSVQEARLALEVLMLREAMTNWRAGTARFEALDDVVATMRTAARSKDFPGMLRADLDFHDVICEAAQNPIFGTLWSAIARHVMIILNLARFRDIDLQVVVRRHQALREQIALRLSSEPSVPDLRALLEAHFQSERAPHQSAAEARVESVVATPPASRRRRAGTSPS